MGFAYNKIICDENGVPVDYRIIDINPTFEKYTYVKKEQVIGKKGSELFAKDRKKFEKWVSILAETALHGTNKEFEEFSEDKTQCFRISVVSPEKYYFATYLIDISKEMNQYRELKKLKESIEKEEKQFQNVIDSLPFSISIVTREGEVLYVNERALELFDIDRNILGTCINNFLWVDVEKRNQWIKEIKEKGIVKNFEMHLKTSKGKEFWAIGSGIIIDYNGQKCVLSSHHDITEIKNAQDALRASEEKYRFLIESVSDVIWVYNLTLERFNFISSSITELRGFELEEVMKNKLEDIMTPESYENIKKELNIEKEEFLKNPKKVKNYFSVIKQPCKNGSSIWVEVSRKMILNDKGDIEIFAVSRNIEERKKTEEKILYLSYRDYLTGLYNRRYYEENASKIDKEENLPLSIIMADVNGLKLTNDAFGHNKGDELLKIFSDILNQNKRNNESIVARIGGDEFILFLPQTGYSEVEKIIENIKKDIQEKREKNILLSVSFGYAVKENIEENISNTFIRAEDAMYKHKLSESRRMKDDMIKSIINSLYKNNPQEKENNKMISKYAMKIGEVMKLSAKDIEDLNNLGFLHNIGKIIIDDFKQDRTQKHPESGYQILKSTIEYSHLAEYVLTHHEFYDGSGFPRGLKGKEIPLLSRILSVAECYVDLKDKEKGIEVLKEKVGNELDGEIVEVFIEKVLR